MADSNATTGELYKAKVILETDVVAAVDAFMADPSTTVFLFGDGYRIDLAEAVSGHEWAKATVANNDTTEHLKRVAVRTAILLARPEKGCDRLWQRRSFPSSEASAPSWALRQS